MPALSDYTAGTITLTNGSTAFTGAGTGWEAADFREGDTILGIEANGGAEYVVETITGNAAGTLTQPWEGVSGTYTYRMRYLADGARVTAQARELIELLGNGNLQSIGGLTGPGVVVLEGPHSAGIRPFTDFINGVAYDVQVDTLADRAAYDGQTAGFAVLVSNVGDGRSALYTKVTNSSGDWSDPAYITGPSITLDVTEVDEVPYGTPPAVVLTPIAGGYTMAFDIPRGMIIEPGTTTTLPPDQPAAVTFVPITGGYRLDIAIPRGPTGDITGVTPFWNTRLGSDTDAASARIGLGVRPKTDSRLTRDSVAELLADEELSYASGPGLVTVGETVDAGPHQYRVAASGATDNDLATAGGVKFYLLRGSEGRFALSGLGVAVGGNITTRLQNLLNRLRTIGLRESVVIDGWFTIDKPIRSAPWIWWYGAGLGMLRAVGPYGNVRFQVAAHDTIPAGIDQSQPMIWMAESPVEPAVLAGDPTLQARIGSSDGTTARRENAYIDVSVTLDCNGIAGDGLFTDNIQNSKFECFIKGAVNYGVRDYFYGWGNEHLESVVSAGLVGKFLSFAGNGVHVGGKQIWGHPIAPSVAHILIEGDSNGMNIDMGFVEEGVTGVLLRRAVGPINISGIDFEIFSSYAIDIDGSTVEGTRPCGPVTVTNCFLETSGTNAVIRVNNGILNVEGCRIRNTSGAAAAGLSVFEVIGANSVVTERNNWIQTSIGNRFVSGVQSFSKSGRTHQRHLTQDATTSLAVIDEQVIRSDPYNRALETMAIRASSIVFDADTQYVGNRLTLTAQAHLGAATTGTSGIEIDASQGATYGVHPTSDDTNQLGRAARQWKTIYLVSAPVVSSDRRKKNVHHELIPEALLDSWSKHVSYGVYSWKNDDGRGMRAGLFAQDIIAAFEEAGIDWTEWAIIEVDENGFYHVVKDEAQAIENAMLRRQLEHFLQYGATHNG